MIQPWKKWSLRTSVAMWALFLLWFVSAVMEFTPPGLLRSKVLGFSMLILGTIPAYIALTSGRRAPVKVEPARQVEAPASSATIYTPDEAPLVLEEEEVDDDQSFSIDDFFPDLISQTAALGDLNGPHTPLPRSYDTIPPVEVRPAPRRFSSPSSPFERERERQQKLSESRLKALQARIKAREDGV